MMNRQTTDAPGDGRAALARRATDALERVACAAGRELDRHAGGYGLSDAKLELLGALCCRERGRACLHALSEELGVTRPNVTKLVDGLERGGLVERMPHPSDGRMVHAHLTDRGRELAGDALPGRLAVIERIWDALGDDDLERLVALLDAVAPRAPAAPVGAAGCATTGP